MSILKWILIVLAALFVIGFAASPFLKQQTKKSSPENTVEYQQGDTNLSVFYNRPFKKGRAIFGGLVPYGETWRTGANEATTFETNKDLTIKGEKLPAGKYTLWTVPNEDKWEVIFNTGEYSWGVSLIKGGKASRNPEKDALVVDVATQQLSTVTEQFTIAFEDMDVLMLTMTWDKTKVAVPIEF